MQLPPRGRGCSRLETIETAVIGAGQAGLALSWHLSQRGCEHLVLERARIARFRIETSSGVLRARNVVVATGPYQRGRVSPLQDRLAPGVLQVHAGDYRNPHQLHEFGLLDQTAAEVPPDQRLPPPLVTGCMAVTTSTCASPPRAGLSLLGHLEDIVNGRLHFADDLQPNLSVGDQSLDDFIAAIDAQEFGSSTNLPAPALAGRLAIASSQ